MHTDTERPATTPPTVSATSPATPDPGDGEDLANSVGLLEADPGHHGAWLRVALRMLEDADASDGDHTLARHSLDSLASAAGEAGHLALAIVAARHLALSGDTRLAQARLMALGNAYGKSSTRVDPTVRPRVALPPPAGSARSSNTPVPVVDPQALRVRAAAALRKAAAHAINVGQQAAAQSGQSRESLPPAPLFSALQPDAFVKLAEQLHPVEVASGAAIFRAGDPGETLYFIARGGVRIEREDGTVLARLRAGSFFGELSLLNRGARSAHALAETKVLLLRADRPALEALAGREPQVAAVLAEHARRRLLQNALVASPLFRVLPPEQRDELISRFTFRRYGVDEVLIEDGTAGTELFVIVGGRVQVSRRQGPGADGLVQVAVLGLGDVLGEIALLSHGRTSAMVHALEPTTTLVLSRVDFDGIVARLPTIRTLLEGLAAARGAQAQPAAAVEITGRLPRHDPETILDADDLEILV